MKKITHYLLMGLWGLFLLCGLTGCSFSISNTEHGIMTERLKLSSYVSTYSAKLKTSTKSNDFTITMFFPKPTVTKKNLVTMKGVSGTTGRYSMPAQDIYIVVPCGYNIDKITVSKLTEGGSITNVKVATSIAATNEERLGESISNTIFGKKITTLGELRYTTQNNGNAQYAKVTISPCDYNGFSKTLKFNTYYEIKVTFKKKSQSLSLMEQTITSNQAQGLKNFVINPSTIDTYNISK